MATLDHLSSGRAAWSIVTSFQQAEAANFGLEDQLSRDERYDRADEFLDVVCKLWDSCDAAWVMLGDDINRSNTRAKETGLLVSGPLLRRL